MLALIIQIMSSTALATNFQPKHRHFGGFLTVCNDSAITLLHIHKPPAFILRLVLTAQLYLCSFITVTSFVKVHMLFQPQNILYMFS